MYAKASYVRQGKVDLDALWFWREIHQNPSEYQVDETLRERQRRQEVTRARLAWDDPWRHFPGDEWLVANPVEVPGIDLLVKSCETYVPSRPAHGPLAGLLALPTEIIHHILFLLGPNDLDSVASTCSTLYDHAQTVFKATLAKDMPWLWEVTESIKYPASPDRHPTWDPLCPDGLLPVTFPPDLPGVEAEEEIWATIIAEDPGMYDAEQASKASSRQRREVLLEAHRAKQAALLQEWHRFRTGVEAWIHTPPHRRAFFAMKDMNWRRLWWLCNPSAAILPGLRNRARIWDDCTQILDCFALSRDRGVIDEKLKELVPKLSDPACAGWSATPEGDDDW